MKKPRYCRLALCVQLLEARPNKMFTEEHRQLVRFLRYSESMKCAECGRKKRTLWTMLCSFQALDMAMIVPKRSGNIHPPLTPVCQTHLLAAEVIEVPAGGS
jgi:hypothetical protein